MSIDHFDRWCTTGTRTEPSSGTKNDGYTPGEQPVSYHWNWLLGELVDRVNRQLDIGVTGFATNQSTDTNILQRYYPRNGAASWSSLWDNGNIVAGSGSRAYRAVLPYWDSSATAGSERKILALDGYETTPTRQFDIIDVATMAIEDNSGDLGGSNLPSIGSEVWVPLCACTDGASAYVVFQDTDASPETYRIQAYDIATWARKSGWPATGTAISGTGSLPQAYHLGDVQVVNATQVAVACPWVTITGGSSTAIQLFAMSDGTAGSTGAGDGSAQYADRLTSDGTNIYYTNPVDGEVNTAVISGMTAGLTGWPLAPASGYARDVLAIGDLVVSTWAISANPVVIVSRANASVDEVSRATGGDTRRVNDLGSIAFDGINIWSKGEVDAGTDIKFSIHRVNIGSAMYDGTTTPSASAMPALEKITNTYTYGAADNVTGGDDEYGQQARICFDGVDIFFAFDMRAEETFSGYIGRMPRAVLR